MQEVKVSIIIPAYNSEQYIKRCIQSALNQTLREIQVIVVDDGSTDQTLTICNSFNDKRITVLHQENTGPAAARNYGLDSATGEYVGFLDSDDYLTPEMYETLYEIAKQKYADIATCSYFLVKEKAQKLDSRGGISSPDVVCYVDKELCDIIKAANSNRILWFAWKSIYKRSMIEEHHIRFPKELSLGEETPFVLECLLCSTKIAQTQQRLYYYVQRQDSLTKTKHKTGYFERLNALYLAKKQVYARYEFTGYEPDLNRYTMEHTIPMMISNELSSGKTIVAQKRCFKKMRDSEMVSEAFKCYDLKLIRSKLRYLAMLLKYRQFALLSVLCKYY